MKIEIEVEEINGFTVLAGIIVICATLSFGIVSCNKFYEPQPNEVALPPLKGKK